MVLGKRSFVRFFAALVAIGGVALLQFGASAPANATATPSGWDLITPVNSMDPAQSSPTKWDGTPGLFQFYPSSQNPLSVNLEFDVPPGTAGRAFFQNQDSVTESVDAQNSASGTDEVGTIKWSFSRPVQTVMVGVQFLEKGSATFGNDPQFFEGQSASGPIADILQNAQVIQDSNAPGLAKGFDTATGRSVLYCPQSASGGSCSGWAIITVPAGLTSITTVSANPATYPAAGFNVAQLYVQSKPPQTVTFNGANLTTATLSFAAPVATTSGNGAITYAVASAGTTGCALTSGSTFSYTGAGVCTITATAAETSTFSPGQATATFTIARIPQTVTFAGASLTLANSSFAAPAATTTGNGAISYSVTSAGSSGCALTSGSTFTYTGVGTCVITATAAQTGVYSSAQQSATFTISAVPSPSPSPSTPSVTASRSAASSAIASTGADSAGLAGLGTASLALGLLAALARRRLQRL